MGRCQVPQERIEGAVSFHGHWCPGLALGVRAAEWALAEVGSSHDEEVVAVTETDMCAVDAVQFLTGCTFGKGNLLFVDHGKVAFSFFRRRDGKGFRILKRPEDAPEDPGAEALRKRIAAEEASEEDRRRWEALRKARCDALLAADLDAIFSVTAVPYRLPERARLLRTLCCDACQEPFMETRGRLFQGKTLCLPCFEAVEGRLRRG